MRRRRMTGKIPLGLTPIHGMALHISFPLIESDRVIPVTQHSYIKGVTVQGPHWRSQCGRTDATRPIEEPQQD